MYMVSDLYIPQCINFSTFNLDEVKKMNNKPLILQLNSNNNSSFTSDHNKEISTINKYCLCVPHKYMNIFKGIFIILITFYESFRVLHLTNFKYKLALEFFILINL